MIRVLYFAAWTLLVGACKEQPKDVLTAQEIVDRSIAISGGDKYSNSTISFSFRDMDYSSTWENNKRKLSRTGVKDSVPFTDVLLNYKFERRQGDSVLKLSDSLANIYSNSLNSVHYFVHLPYGLNDPAVNKELLGETTVKDAPYYKIKITFDEEGGGDDFEDVYVYWIHKNTFKVDYLAYQFHVNGGGIRFRAAYNERVINGIRFVDYENYKADPESVSIYDTDKLYEKGDLELLSKIISENVMVQPTD